GSDLLLEFVVVCRIDPRDAGSDDSDGSATGGQRSPMGLPIDACGKAADHGHVPVYEMASDHAGDPTTAVRWLPCTHHRYRVGISCEDATREQQRRTLPDVP